MSKAQSDKSLRDNGGQVGLAHGRTWPTMEWYVPFKEDHAFIYHGHEDPDDHSDCGPQIFCCPKAGQLLLQINPNAFPADAEWEFTEGEHLVSWVQPDGPKTFYVFFCDPRDHALLRFCGIPAEDAVDVFLKRLPLDSYLEIADQISRSGKRAR